MNGRLIGLNGLALLCTGAIACAAPRAKDSSGATGDQGTGAVDATAAADATRGTGTAGESSGGPGGEGGSSGGERLDVSEDTGVSLCNVGPGGDAPTMCDNTAPAGSFAPEVQWSVPAGDDGEDKISVIPLVANLTDDDGNGTIDLCDTPDVVVLAYTTRQSPSGLFRPEGHIYVYDGDTGARHRRFDTPLRGTQSLALADIDDDGVAEIIGTAYTGDGGLEGTLVAFEPDGTEIWRAESITTSQEAPAFADLDADGDPEIIFGGHILDHRGVKLWETGQRNVDMDLSTAADLDEDGDMEVLQGPWAYHHDGTPYYSSNAGRGHPQVADLDADGRAEVLIAGEGGISILEHDGADKFINTVTGRWHYPAAIHDIDRDGAPDLLLATHNRYHVFDANLTPVWDVATDDSSGFAATTAFDFLGDGQAEAMYADENSLYAFDDGGVALMTVARRGTTLAEFPIVADIDNDGSAEILITSDIPSNGNMLQAIRDADDRWIQARRIWNQHSYHVTNIGEDAVVPTVEPMSWKHLNTFRTNSQIDASGSVCMPPPAG